MGTSASIEALLFFLGEPVKRGVLIELLRVDETELENGLLELDASLKNRGLILMKKGDEVMLGTSPEAAALIERVRREEISRELGKAALETLSVILYKAPVTRADIDYIRGVNSSFILRNLLVRGLIEKKTNPKDSRGFVYEPSFELLSHLGVGELSALPEYGAVQNELQSFIQHKEHESTESENQ